MRNYRKENVPVNSFSHMASSSMDTASQPVNNSEGPVLNISGLVGNMARSIFPSCRRGKMLHTSAMSCHIAQVMRRLLCTAFSQCKPRLPSRTFMSTAAVQK